MSTTSGHAVRRLAGALGAAIDGLDLARPLDDDTMRDVRRAFLENCVLVFPRQTITPAQLCAFAQQWGEVTVYAGYRHVEGFPSINIIQGRSLGTDQWHSDLSFLREPPLGSMLKADQLPSAGGDTLFASQYRAYELLSSGLRRLLDPMRAVHVDPHRQLGQGPGEDVAASQPVVRTHPETGRRALYVNSVYTSHFDGMTVEESQPMLRWLYAHCTQPNVTFRHRWQKGDVVFWDNRCVQHFAVYDYEGETRQMHRITLSGDLPA